MSKEKLQSTVPLNNDQIIVLMGVYLSEWEHRDNRLYAQLFKLFYATLIVTVLPNIAAYIGIDLPDIHVKAFPVIEVFMALVFLYIGTGYAIRL